MPATARADAPGVASGAGILGLLEPIYAAAVRLRGALYDRGWIAAHRLGVPVISVGNLSAGGSGKSPMVALVAGHLARAGFRPAVISRGYGGRHAGPATVVSSGSGPLVGADVAGDEPVMLARMLPELPIVVAHRRRGGGALAIARLGARCLVLDDGFQHRSLARDLDLVLLDARQGFGNGRLLPAGPLREPPSALSRAGALILTRCDRAVPAAVEALAAAAVRHSPGSELFHARSKPVGLVDAASGVAT
ncbi:MAG TPA: tetraacyldisaccharide 4'-kinase, partial [Candidatus Polarisedimenticolia bacterium]|nr:tetraacyldisaccharide 4'-kinase [Candidatus Polarisedimenticolia bacterium]